MEISAEELLFFDAHRDVWPLYICFREKAMRLVPETAIEVKKTQISFKNAHLYAAISFLPARRAADRPPAYITVTFGLYHPVESRRVDACCEPYPNRWTHHVTVGSVEEIDEELLGWILEAADWPRMKRGIRKNGLPEKNL